jgi:alpha-L-fucosidase
MTGREAVHLLVDIVAKGGNLLLNVAPGPDGTWQQGAYDLLAEIGAWIAVNGEGIYGTRAMAPYSEGGVRMTRGKDGAAFFFYLAGEKESAMPAEIRVGSHRPAVGAVVTLLGSTTPLKWKPDGPGFVVTIPEALRVRPPSRYSWAVKVSGLEQVPREGARRP